MADKENKRKCFKCGASPAADNVKLFRFIKPGTRNLERCMLWAQYIFPDREYGSIELQKKLHSEHRMLCQRHFKQEDFTDSSLKELVRTAVPCDTINESPIPGPSQSQNQSGDHSCRSVEEPVNHDIDFENDIKRNADEENNDNDIHFDETEDNFGNDNDNINSNPVEGIEDEFNTHRLDEIDSLFLSYAGAFRKLSPNIQTKLKLDIAKLFARYELKNAIQFKKHEKYKNDSYLPVKETSQQHSFQSLKESVSPVESSITNSNLASWKTSAAEYVNKRKYLSQKSKESVSQEDETRCEESAPALDSPTEHDVKRKCLRQPLMATISKGDATHDETPAPPLCGLPLIESGGQDDIAPTSGSIYNIASSVIASQDASHIASMPLLSCSSLEPVPCDVDLTSEYLVGTRLLEDETLEEIDDCGTLEDAMSRDVTS